MTIAAAYRHCSLLIRKAFGSSLFRSVQIYTLSNIFNAGVPFILMPVLTRYMSTAEYGILAMFNVVLAFVSPFVGSSVHGAISRQYYERDSIDFPKYVGNCLLILCGSTVFVTLVIWLFAAPLGRFVPFSFAWLLLAIGIAFGQFLVLVRLVLWQVQNRPLLYGGFLLLQSITMIGLSLWFVVGLGKSWQGAVAAQFIAVNLFGLFGLFLLLKEGWICWQYDNSYLLRALYFGLPLTPHLIGAMLIGMTDRILITHLIGIAETGIYAVGAQVGMIIALLQNSFNQAWVPWFYQRLKEGSADTKRQIVKATYLYNIVIILAAISLAAVSPWIIMILAGSKYADASMYVFWIALGYAFNGMYKMVTNYIFYTEKTYLLTLVTIFTATLNIGLSYWLIILKGAVGAAQAMAFSFFISFLLTWIVAMKVYPMAWNLWKR